MTTLQEYVVIYHDHGGYTWDATTAYRDSANYFETVPITAIIDRFQLMADSETNAIAEAKRRHREKNLQRTIRETHP